MSDDLSGAYLTSRGMDPELLALNEQFERARAQGDAEAATAKFTADPWQADMQESERNLGGLKRLGKDTAVGLYDALRNTAQTALDVGKGMAGGTAAMMTRPGKEAPEIPAVRLDDLAPDFMAAADELRNRATVGDNGYDVFVQKAMQFTLPFMGAMKLAGVQSIAGGIATETAVNAAVWDPHEARFADLLKEITPDNRLTNVVLDYLASDPNDSDAEGRFKNALDGLMATGVISAAAYPVIKTVQAGAKTLRNIRNNPELLTPRMPGGPATQVGAVNVGGGRLTAEAVSAKADEIASETGVDMLLSVRKPDGYGRQFVVLDEIFVAQPNRGAGVGTEAMQKLVRWADEQGVWLQLSADSGVRGATGSKSANKRLGDFYSRFGFKANTGRNKDFSLGGPTQSGVMYREPKAVK